MKEKIAVIGTLVFILGIVVYLFVMTWKFGFLAGQSAMIENDSKELCINILLQQHKVDSFCMKYVEPYLKGAK